MSQSNIEAVREYIRRQPEHHARQSFQDELLEWLRRYEIAFQAISGSLHGYSSAADQAKGPSVRAGTSPSIAAYEIAFQIVKADADLDTRQAMLSTVLCILDHHERLDAALAQQEPDDCLICVLSMPHQIEGSKRIVLIQRIEKIQHWGNGIL